MKKVMRSNLFFMWILIILLLGSIFSGKIFNMFNISNNASIALVEIIFLLIPTIVYLIITRSSVRETLRLNFIDGKSLITIVGIGLVSYPIMMFIGTISQVFFHNFVNDAFKTLGTIPYIQYLAIAAITPAICEEVVMRGVVLSGYREIPIKKAAILNGFMFGLFHLNPQQFFYAFALGTLFAYLVYLTNSIFSSMICHFMLNGISVTASWFVANFMPKQMMNGSKDFTQIGLQQQLTLVISTFIFALIFSFFLVKLLKSLKNANRNKEIYIVNTVTDESKKKEKVMNWPMFVSIGIYIGFLVIHEISSDVSFFNF